MKVLVTGASGFIGSALVPELRLAGHEVWEGLRYKAGAFDFWDEGKRVFFDLRDTASIREAVKQCRPEVIIHLGAVSAVSYSFTHWDEVQEVIYNGTVRLAEAAREQGVQAFVFASTSEVYGRKGDYSYPLTEEMPIGGTSPYASAKVSAELYLQVLRDVYSFPIVILRPFNTISRGFVPPVGNRHYVVERAITQAIEKGEINLHDPRPLRDFLHRIDHVNAHLAVMAKLEKAIGGKVFNVCTGGCISIGEMAEYVASLVRRRFDKEVQVSFSETSDRPLDIPRLQGSNKRAKEVLGWEPRYTIEEALKKAVEEWALRLSLA